MNRRKAIKQLGLGAGATVLGTRRLNGDRTNAERVLRIAHITDVHIRPEENAPERFSKCLKEVVKHDVDFFLNGGDTVFAVDYADITRERVHVLWDLWHAARKEISGYEVHSCLGNHDMWWAAPDKGDEMYGKAYAVSQLNIPHRYYAFEKSGWHFIILDSNNQNAGSLDESQMAWLEAELAKLKGGTPVLVMSHYPILAPSTILVGGNHTDSPAITKLFYKHPDKKIHCISGHVHLLDHCRYNQVDYYCNGAMSGFWWGEGDEHSAGKSWYHETPPGYAILELFSDGRLENTYFPHPF